MGAIHNCSKTKHPPIILAGVLFSLEEELKSYEPGVTAGFAFTKIAGFTGLVGLAGTVALAAVRAASKAALEAALASLVVADVSAVLRVARAASMVA